MRSLPMPPRPKKRILCGLCLQVSSHGSHCTGQSVLSMFGAFSQLPSEVWYKECKKGKRGRGKKGKTIDKNDRKGEPKHLYTSNTKKIKKKKWLPPPTRRNENCFSGGRPCIGTSPAPLDLHSLRWQEPERAASGAGAACHRCLGPGQPGERLGNRFALGFLGFLIRCFRGRGYGVATST